MFRNSGCPFPFACLRAHKFTTRWFRGALIAPGVRQELLAGWGKRALVCLIRYTGDSSNAATCVFDVVLHAISKALEARSKSKQAPPVLRPSWRVSKTRVLKSIISMFSGQCGHRKHWCVCVMSFFLLVSVHVIKRVVTGIHYF